MDMFGKLMFAATLRRAMALQVWVEEHEACSAIAGDGIRVERVAKDGFTVVAHCSCGGSYEGTVVVAIAERRMKAGASQWESYLQGARLARGSAREGG